MKKIIEQKTENEQQTETVAIEFAANLKHGDFVAMYGEMGAGKTAFVRGIASVLCKLSRVSSPTYAIVNEYNGKIPVFHFDLYRITDDDSLYATGFYDYFDRNGIIIAEWCENVPFALPVPRYEVKIEKCGTIQNESERMISIWVVE